MDTQVHAQWSKVTVLHPVEGAILLAMIVAMLWCKRRYAVWPAIVIACFVVPSQRIVIGGLDFTLMRIIVLVGMLRVLMRGEYKAFKWNPLDFAFVAFILLRAIMALFGDFPPGEFTQRAGSAVESLATYFMVRCVVRDWSDLFTTIRGFIWIGVPVAICFVIEAITQRNVFGAFGYVSEIGIVRDGHYRAQGAFAHPILAGVYWAVLMPLMASLFWQKRRWAKFEAILGLLVSSTIIVTCASSTPVMAVLFGLLGAALFPLRQTMRVVRWGLLAGFIAFQCLSDKPAWRLLVDIDIVGGSTGYYRYQLIDEAIKHFSEWAPMGGNIDTTKWSPNLVDDANHYLMVALQGGMPLLTLFVIVISLAFASIGRARLRAGRDRALVIASWALGVSLFMHIMSFFSVFYFGQSVMLWDLTLAMIGSIRPTGKMMQSPPREISAPRRQFSAGPARVGAPLSATVWGK